MFKYLINKAEVKILPLFFIISISLIITVSFVILFKISILFISEPYKQIFEKIYQKDTIETLLWFKAYINGLKVNKELFFTFLQIFQVFVAPIPGQVVTLIGGLIFGFWKAFILTMLGTTIGSILAMLIARKFGKPLISFFLPKNLLDKFEYIIEKGKINTFFMIYLLPALPDDAVCFVAGLTKLPIPKLITACFLGRIPSMAILVFTGSNIENNFLLTKVIFGLAILTSFLFWIFSDEVYSYLKKYNFM